MSESVQDVQDRVQREGAADRAALDRGPAGHRRPEVPPRAHGHRPAHAGHLLLEGVPGLAKTLAVRSLAGAMHGSFRRIQFTPDLLPADLTGTLIYNQKDGTFVPRKGPLFANFVLADEINRAPAKVQSALLEAMQERQVTIGDTTYPLPVAVPRPGDAEPDRAGGDLPAPRGPGRPLPAEAARGLPVVRGGAADPRPDDGLRRSRGPAGRRPRGHRARARRDARDLRRRPHQGLRGAARPGHAPAEGLQARPRGAGPVRRVAARDAWP